MHTKGSFKKQNSTLRNDHSIQAFKEILNIKKQIHFDTIKNKLNGNVRDLFSNWTYLLGMGIRRERDLHAHSIGKQYRLPQWHAELYCLSKNYDECAVELLDKFNLQHMALLDVVKNIPVGKSALLWKKIEKQIEELVNLHRPMVFYCAKTFKKYYRIPIDDIVQVCWMVLVESIQHFDVTLNVPFINYYMLRVRVYLRRAYTNSCDLVLRDDEFLHFAKLQYLIEKHNENIEDPRFITKCKLLFQVDNIEPLLEDHMLKQAALSMGDISMMPNVSMENEAKNGTFEEKNETNSRNDFLMKCVEQLDDMTRRILLLHFGFTDNRTYNREEIALKLNIPVFRVRRLKNEGLEKLKKLMENAC